jgi:hypothetical protein
MRPKRISDHADHGSHKDAKAQSDMKPGFHVIPVT